MQLIVTVKLDNGELMGIVGEGINNSSIKSLAVQQSTRLWGDKELRVNRHSPIISTEALNNKEQEHEHEIKKYMVSFLMDEITQALKIEAKSIRDAYNKIRTKYGIQDNIFMMIYEINQFAVKDSAIEVSKIALRNSNSLNEIFRKAVEKSKDSEYGERVQCLLQMINNSIHGRYSRITRNNIIIALADIVYFTDPTIYTLECFNGKEQIYDKEAFTFILRQLTNDRMAYM